MIYTVNIKDLKRERMYTDEQWAIVRSMKSPSTWIKQVAALSPSTDLFYKYLDLKKKGQWNEQTFQSVYVPQFLHDIKHDREAIDLLNDLWARDKKGENVWLACFCIDETMCHTSIIAGLLQGAGCSVQTRTGQDYSKYWDMFRQL